MISDGPLAPGFSRGRRGAYPQDVTHAADDEGAVRFTPAVAAWLDAYAAGRPRWDHATAGASRRVVAEIERVASRHPDLPRAAVVRLVARDTGLAEREVAAAFS